MVDVYFRIGGYTFDKSFGNERLALNFLDELESFGFEDGGTVREGTIVGCNENGKYGINVWEKFSQRRVTRSELEKVDKNVGDRI